MKSHLSKSLRKSTQTVPIIEEMDMSSIDLNASRTNLHSDSMKTPSVQGLKEDVHSPQSSHSITEKHSTESMNQVATQSMCPVMEQIRVISILLLDNEYNLYSSSLSI